MKKALLAIYFLTVSIQGFSSAIGYYEPHNLTREQYRCLSEAYEAETSRLLESIFALEDLIRNAKAHESTAGMRAERLELEQNLESLVAARVSFKTYGGYYDVPNSSCLQN